MVLGTGELAYKCAKFINENQILVKFFDTNFTQSKILQRKIEKENIEYLCKTKHELIEILENTSNPVVLMSAINPHLIPKKILEKQNIRAINLHPALLPRHPGRNVEAWTIFEQDQEAGITWHVMTPIVDTGNILIQKRISIDDRYTSLKLLSELHNLAYDSFLEIFNMVFDKKDMQYTEIKQERNKLHYSWEIPNDGYLDLTWKGEKISAFLRAMDFGFLEFLGKPKLTIDLKYYIWNRYKITKKPHEVRDRINFTGSMLNILKPGYLIELHGMKEVICQNEGDKNG